MICSKPLITPNEKIAVVAVVKTMVQLVVKRPKEKNWFVSNSNRFKTRMAGRGTDGIPTCMKEDMHWMGCNHGVN